MGLGFAILASLVVESPCSGYDLVKRFDERVSCFWAASHQQVYRELRQLKERDWVSCETVIQTGRPNKQVYCITALGQAQLTEWIEASSEPTAIREELMVKMLAGHLVSEQKILDELKRRYEIHQEKLITLKDMECKDFPDLPHLSLEKKFLYLTLRRGIRYETDWIAWCEEAIQLLGTN